LVSIPQVDVFGGLSMSMYIGEALCGDGNEIAHIDLLIGSKEGPVGTALGQTLLRINRLATQAFWRLSHQTCFANQPRS